MLKEAALKLWKNIRPGISSLALLATAIVLFSGLFIKFKFDAKKDVPTKLLLNTESTVVQPLDFRVEYPGYYDVWLEIDHHQPIGTEGCLFDLGNYGGSHGDPNCKVRALQKVVESAAFRDGKEVKDWNEPGSAVYGKQLQVCVGGGGRIKLLAGDLIRTSIRFPESWSSLASFHPTLAIERSENAADTEGLLMLGQLGLPVLVLLSLLAWLVEVGVRWNRKQR